MKGPDRMTWLRRRVRRSLLLLLCTLGAAGDAHPDGAPPGSGDTRSGNAQGDTRKRADDAAWGKGCADREKLVAICGAVEKKWDGPKGSDYDYMYEKMIH